MGAGRVRHLSAACAVALTAGATGLSACAISGADAPGGPAALFRAHVGRRSEAVSPALSTAWYVQHGPVQYAKVGQAGFADDHPGAFSHWFAKLFHRKAAAPAAPVAVAAASLDLPVPSIVEVTNLRTFKTVTVRINDKAPLRGMIVRLPAETAQALGAEPGKPLSVRLRYSAPVLAYNEPPSLRFAMRGAMRRNPTASPTLLAAQTHAAPGSEARAAPMVRTLAPMVSAAPPSPAALPAGPPLVRVAETHLAPPRAPRPALRPAIEPEAPAATHAKPSAAGAEPTIAGPSYRIQVGAFAKRDNADRAMSRLAAVGGAAIVPLRRGDLTLYRVVVSGPKDLAGAEKLRARVAVLGFTDARLIKPL